ncbi:2-hydroxyglutaryl-CoA dehydratase [Alkaliphilus pronyensis]|uniref:2-hydroxyglutaryl-CoA dehydratase n=1 Tax=Alkaliphilus pronyensis TaxID=1482732 RepID=A0A6I0F969_9FIRM|nr:acyl-CoA dehydratase activase [Alkaliphilus pronyensis]KAB3534816.1 2-hydroxyglutaryl-CoA dehydratase [Alkaliphilus pronyensis]
MISIGIDIGSVAAKAVAYDGEKILAQELIPTGWSPREAGRNLFQAISKYPQIDTKDIKCIVGTGYGRIALPFIDKKVTEITCHGKGAHFIDPNIRTIIDIGGQDSKVIRIDDRGNVIDFIMNDKCAAGTGRFLQAMAHTLEVDVSELSLLAEGVEAQNINSMCTVFAESEIISLMAEGASKESISAGLLQSVCKKTYSLASKVQIADKVFFSGGVSKNYFLKKLLENKLQAKIKTTDNAQFLGAIGAAIIGSELRR